MMLFKILMAMCKLLDSQNVKVLDARTRLAQQIAKLAGMIIVCSLSVSLMVAMNHYLA